jgi:hypothetical protein
MWIWILIVTANPFLLCDDEDIHDFGLPPLQPQSLDQPQPQPQLQDQLNADTVLEVETANLRTGLIPLLLVLI